MNVLTEEEVRTCLRLYREPIAHLTEDENWWRLGLIALSKKQALFRAGFAAPVVASTRFVLQPFNLDDLHGVVLVLVTGGKPASHFAGWVPRTREAEAQGWVDTLNRAIETALRSAPQHQQPIDQHLAALVFESGSEVAPDDPFGLETVMLAGTGELTYERRRDEVQTKVAGTLDPERFRRIVSALLRTNFPSPPQTRFVAGASIVRITTMPSRQTVQLDYFEALRMDGYREVVRELAELTEALRDSKTEVLAAWRFSPAPVTP